MMIYFICGDGPSLMNILMLLYIIDIYVLDSCLLMDELIACSACVGRSAPPQATHTHACPSASHPQQQLLSSALCLLPHTRGHLIMHHSATAVFHQRNVLLPVSPSDTIGWITRIFDTNG